MDNLPSLVWKTPEVSIIPVFHTCLPEIRHDVFLTDLYGCMPLSLAYAANATLVRFKFCNTRTG